jgi:hypothetical protein
MAGLNPDGTYEVYARSDDLGRPLVDQLEEMAFGSSGVLSAAVATFIGAPELPRRVGISVLLAPSGQAMALTWFTSALSNFRDDAAAGRAISALAAGSCAPGSLEIYRALAAGPSDGRWRHTVVGVGLSADGRSWLQTGLRPT